MRPSSRSQRLYQVHFGTAPEPVQTEQSGIHLVHQVDIGLDDAVEEFLAGWMPPQLHLIVEGREAR
jgi:hypothetical protein